MIISLDERLTPNQKVAIRAVLSREPGSTGKTPEWENMRGTHREREHVKEVGKRARAFKDKKLTPLSGGPGLGSPPEPGPLRKEDPEKDALRGMHDFVTKGPKPPEPEKPAGQDFGIVQTDYAHGGTWVDPKTGERTSSTATDVSARPARKVPKTPPGTGIGTALGARIRAAAGSGVEPPLKPGSPDDVRRRTMAAHAAERDRVATAASSAGPRAQEPPSVGTRKKDLTVGADSLVGEFDTITTDLLAHRAAASLNDPATTTELQAAGFHTEVRPDLPASQHRAVPAAIRAAGMGLVKDLIAKQTDRRTRNVKRAAGAQSVQIARRQRETGVTAGAPTDSALRAVASATRTQKRTDAEALAAARAVTRRGPQGQVLTHPGTTRSRRKDRKAAKRASGPGTFADSIVSRILNQLLEARKKKAKGVPSQQGKKAPIVPKVKKEAEPKGLFPGTHYGSPSWLATGAEWDADPSTSAGKRPKWQELVQGKLDFDKADKAAWEPHSELFGLHGKILRGS